MTYELPATMNSTNTTNNNLAATNNNNNNNNNASSSNLKTNTSKKPDDSTTSSTISNSNQRKNSKLNPTDIVTSTSNLNMIASETNLNVLKEYIWYHLNNLLQNENADILIESSQILNSKLNELLMRVNECNNILLSESLKATKSNQHGKAGSQYMLNVTSSLISDRCVALKQKLNEFFIVLKNELKTNRESISVIDSTNQSASLNHLETNSAEISLNNHDIPDELLYSPSSSSSSSSSSCASPMSDTSYESCHDSKLNSDFVASSNNLSTQVNCRASSNNLKISDPASEKSESNKNICTNENSSGNNSIKRRIMLNSISKLYKHRRRVMTRANSLKKSIKQLIKLADFKSFDTNQNSNNMSSHEIRININECKSTSDISNLHTINYYDYEDDDVYENNSNTNNWIKKTSTTNDITIMNNQTSGRSQRPNSLNIVSHNKTQEAEFNFTTNKKSSFLAEDLNENFKSLSFNRPRSVANLTNSNIVINDQKKAITTNGILPNHAETASSNSIKCKDDSSNSGTFNDSNSLLGKSPSILTINRTLAGINDVPLASEEQSCMSTPNTTNLSLSIDSIYKQQQQLTQPKNGIVNCNNTKQSLLSRPNQLDLIDKHTSIASKTLATKTTSNDTNDGAPKIRITSTCDDSVEFNYESDCVRLDPSRSPSYLGYITSTSSLSITPNSAYDLNGLNKTPAPSEDTTTNSKYSPKTKQKHIPAPLFLLPPSSSSLGIKNSSPNLNSSSSSNNLSSRMNEFKHLGVPLSPSGYSSSGSCYSKTTLPSPRISKKYAKEIMSSTMHLQLPAKRGISALSSSFRRRSLSKSSEKSSSPTSPSSPKLMFKFNPVSSPFGFVGQALLFNADALCAPIAAPVINEPIL